jgi:hypothetical protein
MSSGLESGFLNSPQAHENRQKLRAGKLGDVRESKPPAPGNLDPKIGKPQKLAETLRARAATYPEGEARQRMLKQADEILRQAGIDPREGSVN